MKQVGSICIGMEVRGYSMSIKLFLSLFGIFLLILGSLFNSLPDWDVYISILMGGLTAIHAPAFVRSIVEQKGNKLVVHLMIYIFIVDWLYVNYNEFIGASYVREENFIVSSLLYAIAGIILYQAERLDANLAEKHIRTTLPL